MHWFINSLDSSRIQWRRERGAKVGIRPGRHYAGGTWRGENGILKFGCFWQIGICIADSDILYPLISLTLPQFWDHTPNCQCSTTPHKAVYTPRNLHCWPDWSFTCCKTYRKSILSSYCFTSQFNVLHYLHVLKFCIKFGNSAWNSVIWFSEKSLNLLQPDPDL